MVKRDVLETRLLSIFYSNITKSTTTACFSLVLLIFFMTFVHVATVQMVYLELVCCDMKFVITQIKADKAVSAVL